MRLFVFRLKTKTGKKYWINLNGLETGLYVIHLNDKDDDDDKNNKHVKFRNL